MLGGTDQTGDRLDGVGICRFYCNGIVRQICEFLDFGFSQKLKQSANIRRNIRFLSHYFFLSCNHGELNRYTPSYRISILHHTSNIVRISIVCQSFVKIILTAGIDVVPNNPEIPIPIAPSLFVSLSKTVQHFVSCCKDLNKG